MSMPLTLPTQVDPMEQSLSIRKHLTVGLIGLAVLVVAVGYWGFTATIDSSIISSGSLRSFVKPQSIQHADGGHVAAINVKNGDPVAQDDILIVLDDTIIKAGLAILDRQIADLSVANYRLKIERSNGDSFETPVLDLGGRLPATEIDQIVEGQRALFAARFENRNKQLVAVDTRVGQLEVQNIGSRKLIETRKRQLQNSQGQLDKLSELEKNGLATATAVLSQRQTLEDLNGTLLELENNIVSNQSRKAELEANKARINIEWFERAEQQLAENEVRLSELKQRRLVEMSRLSRIELKAPVSGIIHKLAANTVGGVVAPATELMQIIPSVTDLQVEAQIAPQDIDQVYAGQDASVRFSTFSTRDTPELQAKVVTVSPDVYVDQSRGFSYYVAELRITEGEMEKLAGYDLVPGMPAEVFVRLGERSPVSYLIKPFADNFRRVFREE